VPWSTFAINGQRKYLTRTEADRFLAVAKNRNLSVYTFCWFIAASGCRISEALMTTAKCVDFETGLIIIESLKKRRKNVYRAVPLPSSLLDHLAELISLFKKGADDRLWPWSRMTGYRRITEVMTEAQIAGTWASPKGLRHGFGVRAVQSGAPLHLVQRWLGHADMKTTAIYASAVGPEEREIASKTWLDDEEEDEGGEERFATRAGRKAGANKISPELTNLEQKEPTIDGTEKTARKPWFNRIASATQSILTCQMIHFYLFCHKFFH
jgi:integrase